MLLETEDVDDVMSVMDTGDDAVVEADVYAVDVAVEVAKIKSVIVADEDAVVEAVVDAVDGT